MIRINTRFAALPSPIVAAVPHAAPVDRMDPSSTKQRDAFVRFGPAFERAIDEATLTTVKPGNAVKPLFDGGASFAERKRLIQSATKTIHLQTFIFNDDETGRDMAKLLIAAAQRGVKVRVIYDGFGTPFVAKEMFDEMRAAGVEVRAYAEPWRQPLRTNARWHEKLLIVDSEQAISGGLNTADEYAFGGTDRVVLTRGRERIDVGWRDVDLLSRGPILRDLELEFTRNWAKLGPALPEAELQTLLARVPKAIPGGSDVRYVANDPRVADGNKIEDTLYFAITSAQHHITIESPFFAPTQALKDALIEAVKRGVKVRILTNSPASIDSALVSTIARQHARELVASGVEIFQRREVMVHAKTYTFDGVYSVIGSANFNRRSTRLDLEGFACVRSAAVAQALEARFDLGLPEAQRLTREALAADPWHVRAKEWVATTALGSFV
ncbi:MAG: phosphatidylserine/phosphatidylglycerophosphate/cardiolipin synthase family protein [Deltaproteobacteria bacterium]|nr:phosphatidylserine/phosphatidylglycerophosphate/cardiolipin synthase family protein [Deltaproteobacteria bacterium]